jgi:hypothetical protein
MTITTPGGETTISESYLLVHLVYGYPKWCVHLAWSLLPTLSVYKLLSPLIFLLMFEHWFYSKY